ncbi:MAG: hypothetical protein M1823_001075 [Watsoniomyces obsoletus]|nr:MAG: hypothetical protein M1823_001075 [Watsoniomyces obsoletus]
MMTRELDLELDTLWFTKSAHAFLPPSLEPIRDMTSKAAFKRIQEGSRVLHCVTTAILWTDHLSVSKFRLTWDLVDPKGTVRAEQKHLPPPALPSPAELSAAQQRYGPSIVRWCREHEDTRVGNGQCWTLARKALEAIADECRLRDEEPPMLSQGRVHGACIFISSLPSTVTGTMAERLKAVGVAEGDILELKDTYFHCPSRNKDKTGSKRIAWKVAERHTAVITAVEEDTLSVLEQNATVGKKVRRGSYRLDQLMQGEVRIYRPVGKGWCPLNLDW